MRLGWKGIVILVAVQTAFTLLWCGLAYQNHLDPKDYVLPVGNALLTTFGVAIKYLARAEEPDQQN